MSHKSLIIDLRLDSSPSQVTCGQISDSDQTHTSGFKYFHDPGRPHVMTHDVVLAFMEAAAHVLLF